jgi:NAD(P)H dehydrogenase (quinone)
MTVSGMSLRNMIGSLQHRQHWLAEQVLNWSGLPVVHVRPTVFQEVPFFLPWAAEQIRRDDAIRLPFGSGHTSPVAVQDVAEVIAAILVDPAQHIGKLYELTGPRSLDMNGLAGEYSKALGRPVTYVDVPMETWHDEELRARQLPEYLTQHLMTMARLHAANGYDRQSPHVEELLGRPARSLEATIRDNQKMFSAS